MTNMTNLTAAEQEILNLPLTTEFGGRKLGAKAYLFSTLTGVGTDLLECKLCGVSFTGAVLKMNTDANSTGQLYKKIDGVKSHVDKKHHSLYGALCEKHDKKTKLALKLKADKDASTGSTKSEQVEGFIRWLVDKNIPPTMV